MSIASLTPQKTSLSAMDLPALQNYATIHKDDPYTVLAALSMANKKKKAMTAEQGQAGAAQAPKAVDQAIANMNPMKMDQALAQQYQAVPTVDPEKLARRPLKEAATAHGLEDLPADNLKGMATMAAGGIVAFDDGGEVPGYAGGVFTGVKRKYKELNGYTFEGGTETFEKALDSEGVTDPRQRAFLRAIHQQESEQALNAPTRKDSKATGPMQVTPGAWQDVFKQGEKLNSLKDPMDNMRAGIRYANKGWALSPDNPELAATHYFGGKGGFDKAVKGQGVASAEDKNKTTLQYGKEVATKMNEMMPIGTATAGTAQSQGLAGLIPGQSVKAPAAVREEPGFFSRLGDKMNLSEDTKRNLSNLNNAFAGAMGPAYIPSYLPKTQGALSGIAKLGENLYNKVVPSGQISESGIKAMQAETQAANAAKATKAAETALQTQKLAEEAQLTGATPDVTSGLSQVAKTAQEIDAAHKAEALTQAAELAKLPSAAEKVQAASMAREANDANRITQAGRIGQMASQAVADTGLATLPTDATEKGIDTTSQQMDEQMGNVPVNAGIAKLLPSVEDSAKSLTDTGPKKGSNFDFNDFLIRMGLGMMAGKSPHALTNVGEAGLGALTSMDAQRKAEAERAYQEAHAKLFSAQGEQARANAASIDRGAKEKNIELEIEKLVAAEIGKNKMLSLDPAARIAEENRLRKNLYESQGLTYTGGAGAGSTSGFKFLGVK